MDRHGEVVVRVHQAQRTGDDAVPVRIGIVGESNVELILQPHEPGHRIGAGTIHADLAVMIDRHEGEGRIDGGVDHGDVETIDSIDRLPVVDRGAAERIDAQLETCATGCSPCR